MMQTLLERELRRAMEAEEIESLPFYPEQRECRRPTTRRLLDIFEPIQRHTYVRNLEKKITAEGRIADDAQDRP